MSQIINGGKVVLKVNGVEIKPLGTVYLNHQIFLSEQNVKDLQYFHNNNEQWDGYDRPSKSTMAIVKLDPEAILATLRASFASLEKPIIPVIFGVAFCHPKDQYERRTGRQIALGNLKELMFELDLRNTYGFTDDALWISLRSFEQKTQTSYTITIKIYKDSKRLRIVGAYPVRHRVR